MDADDPDLARRKWFDLNDVIPRLPGSVDLTSGSCSEDLLHDIRALADEIFDTVSVLEQYPETTSRGAVPKANLLAESKSIFEGLRTARDLLAVACTEAAQERSEFVDSQLRTFRESGAREVLKLHIGSGAAILPGWLNLDAGGADLALNVNWGLPFPDESVRFVYTAHVLEHLRFGDQAPQYVGEIRRVLKPNGAARFVVPDLGRLLDAYARRDAEFFEARSQFYPMNAGFVDQDGIPTLDYLLLFSGSSWQTMNYNHKFGYDAHTLQGLLRRCGFKKVEVSAYQGSRWDELRVDDGGYNARTSTNEDEHFSLFVDATS